MDYHGITMQGDFETDNIIAKDADGIKMYDDSSNQAFTVLDGGKIKALIGTSINEFSIDATLADQSDDALCTEKAIYDFVNTGFQPLSSHLTTLAGLDPDDNAFIVGTGSTWQTETGATARASLGLGSAAIRDAEDTLTNGGNLPDGAAIKAYCDDRYLNEDDNLSDLANATTARSNLGVEIGADVQAWDEDLDAIAALTPTDGNFIVGSGSNWVAESGNTARASLGLTGNNNTTHYHDSRYYQQTEFGDATISPVFNTLEVSGSGKAAGKFYTGDTDPTNTTRLNYDGEFYATKVHNAVYNDVADFRPLKGYLVYGKCYSDTVEGAEISNKRCQKSVIGIASDTFGLSCGVNKDEIQVPIAICGWVLAYVDKEYEIGTPLTNDEKGNLTEISKEEKRDYPERIVAVYSKKETNTMWNSIEVNGRHWVKIK